MPCSNMNIKKSKKVATFLNLIRRLRKVVLFLKNYQLVGVEDLYGTTNRASEKFIKDN